MCVCVLHSNRCFAETTDKVYNKNMLQAALITFINICLNQKTPDLHSDYWLRFISWVHLWYHTVQDFLFLMWIHVFPISAWASDICLTHSWLTRFSSCCCQLCNFVTKESVTFHTSVHFFHLCFYIFGHQRRYVWLLSRRGHAQWAASPDFCTCATQKLCTKKGKNKESFFQSDWSF